MSKQQPAGRARKDHGIRAEAARADPGHRVEAARADPETRVEAAFSEPGIHAEAAPADSGAEAALSEPGVGAGAARADSGVGAEAALSEPAIGAGAARADPGVFAEAARADSGIRAEAARAAADFGAANDAVDDAAATLLGVNRTDLRILGLILDAGALSAAPLAGAAKLSPAATTTAIQRLVAAGHLTRTVDAADRRRAVVAITPHTMELLDRIYGPIGHAGLRELARYSAAELAVITDFLRRGRSLQLAQADRIRGMTT